MPTLLIKTKDGTVYRASCTLHAIMADELNIDFDKIINVGFVTRDRDVWCNRQPH